MELNQYIFPAPRASYTVKSLHKILFYIPHKGDFRSHFYNITKSKTRAIRAAPGYTHDAPKPKFTGLHKLAPVRDNSEEMKWSTEGSKEYVECDLPQISRLSQNKV